MSEALTCRRVQDLIDVVANDAVAGESLTERHGAVMAHLRQCARCRASYFFLLDTLNLRHEAEARLAAAGDPVPLSFNGVEEASTWRRLGDRHPDVYPLGFQISRGRVKEALRAWHMGGGREPSPSDQDEGAVLFSEWLGTEQGTVTVRLTGRPYASDPERMDLEARITGRAPLPAGLHVSLLWGDEFQAAPLDEEGVGNVADFRMVGAWEDDDEAYAPDLILTFGTVREDESRGG
jgi:hypothetical protein